MSDLYRPRTPVGQRLGDLLFDAGLVTEAQLNRALLEQQRSGERLGRLLVAADVITEAQLVDVLARHFGLDAEDLEERVPDFNARRLLQECIMHLASERAEAEEDRRATLTSPHDGASDAPVVQFVNDLLTRAVTERATHVHLEPGEHELRIRFRVDGVLLDAAVAPSPIRLGVVHRLKVMGELDVAERRLAQDGSVTLPVAGATVDLGMVAVPTTHGESLVIRVRDRSAPPLPVDDLGFLPQTLARYRSLYEERRGAVLAVGPAGSGRTATLYGALADLGDAPLGIVTVEQTVGHHLEGVKQVQVDQKAGLGLARALGAVLAADPDVVLVEAIGDREVAGLALGAALAGRLVLATLHGHEAAAAPARLVDMGMAPFLVTSALRGVVAQRLVRQLCPSCKQPWSPEAAHLAAVGWDDSLGAGADGPRFHRAVGCDHCAGSGYLGRLAVQEVMPVTDDVARLVLAGAPVQAVRDLAVEQGMTTMRRDGLAKAALGRTTLEELLRAGT